MPRRNFSAAHDGSARSPAFIRALPAYRGGKRKLAPLILALIAQYRPRDAWPELQLGDPFAGSCALSLYAKANGFKVTASDIAERSAVTARALIANSSVRLSPADVMGLFAESRAKEAPHLLTDSRSIFTLEQSRFIARGITNARRRPEPMRSLLSLVVIKLALRMQPFSVLDNSDALAAASGDFDRVSSRRVGHYLKAQRVLLPDAVRAVANDVNAGVFAGCGEAAQCDALTAISRTSADVLYLDPPYPGTAGYRDAYAALDRLLGDEDLATTPPTLDELFAAAASVPLIALSFGGPRVTIGSLVDQVQRHRPVLDAIAVPYPHLRSLSKQKENHEYIVIAGR